MRDDKARELPVEPEDVASATECTGLMPALPGSSEGAAEEAALYGIHRARVSLKKR